LGWFRVNCTNVIWDWAGTFGKTVSVDRLKHALMASCARPKVLNQAGMATEAGYDLALRMK